MQQESKLYEFCSELLVTLLQGYFNSKKKKIRLRLRYTRLRVMRPLEIKHILLKFENAYIFKGHLVVLAYDEIDSDGQTQYITSHAISYSLDLKKSLL
jgi:hypothetical protein